MLRDGTWSSGPRVFSQRGSLESGDVRGETGPGTWPQARLLDHVTLIPSRRLRQRPDRVGPPEVEDPSENRKTGQQSNDDDTTQKTCDESTLLRHSDRGARVQKFKSR